MLWYNYHKTQTQLTYQFVKRNDFLPRCMEYRCGLAIKIPSVRLSVCQTRDL